MNFPLKKQAFFVAWSALMMMGCMGQPSSSQTASSQPSHPAIEQEKTPSPPVSSEAQLSQNTTPAPNPPEEPIMEKAIFGAGCFWCVEAVFQELDGVVSVESGYMGGTTENPTYPQVCTGTTGHAEVCVIEFDPKKISFAELLEVFWKTHDPTTLNRQGADRGTQYRSVIFYETEAQRVTAEHYKEKLNDAHAFPRPIVTQIVPAARFYPAEDYHQDFFEKNPDQAYCRLVIPPKLEKLREAFGDKLKE